jgi:hypothetical protein
LLSIAFNIQSQWQIGHKSLPPGKILKNIFFKFFIIIFLCHIITCVSFW